MAKAISIKLDEPLAGHGDPIRVVTVREPRAGDILEIGEPVIVGSTESQVLVSVEDDGKVRRYIERLTQDETGRVIDPNILAQASLVDILRIREAVIDFFTQARQRASSLRSD